MKRGIVCVVALALLGIGASAAQAQCCGYSTFYSAPAYTSFYGSSCDACTPCYSSCYSCYSPSYTSFHTPYYTGYTPYYSGYWGWGGRFGWARPWRTGYWGWGW